jgi:hypothetical protein
LRHMTLLTPTFTFTTLTVKPAMAKQSLPMTVVFKVSLSQILGLCAQLLEPMTGHTQMWL